MIRALFVGALLALTALSALAHDADGYSNWVSGLVNPLSGADCCGLNDCKEIPAVCLDERADGEEKAGGCLDTATGDVVAYSTVLGKGPGGKWWDCLGSRAAASADGLTWGAPQPFTRCLIGPPPSS